MAIKTLEERLARIHANPHGGNDYILADAKDADMALSIGAPGRSPERWPDGEMKHKTLAEFREQITEIVHQGLVDIMLMSASTAEVLCMEKRLFENSKVTPAARANDTTDIHIVRGSRYPGQPSLPFRTATLDHIMCGKAECEPGVKHLGPDLGLYSITFANDSERDRIALEEYKQFRIEAEIKGFRHFLEVFDPNVAGMVDPAQLGGFVNDCIVRALGGVTSRGRPVFLKIVYHGARAMEELVRYDPHLVVGILGGSAGTTYDAFKLLSESKKYGARVALFGRKINNAENQLAFIRFLRLIADGEITAEEAVKAYHGVLDKLNIKPQRSLREDMEITTGIMNYGGGPAMVTVPGNVPGKSPAKPTLVAAGSKPVTPAVAKPAPKPETLSGVAKHIVPEATPDFSKMTSAEKVAWQKARWDRILGK
jgi:hypothetical protein